MSNRVAVLHQPGVVEVRLTMRRSWLILVPLTLWIVGWTIAGAAVIVSLVSGNLHDAGFLLIWLAVWLFAEVFAGLAWLWHAFGREIVTVSGGTLTIKRDVFGFGPARAYDTGEVRNLRALGYFGSLMSWSFGMVTWGLSGGTVAFGYRGKTHRFGIQLEEPEAEVVADALRPYLPGL